MSELFDFAASLVRAHAAILRAEQARLDPPADPPTVICRTCGGHGCGACDYEGMRVITLRDIVDAKADDEIERRMGK